ncbi:MAG: HNH endonuclease [Planctomycetes bacterium]|nr:HNH endonuclease [Planctomycetota bacterium]
MRDSPLETVAFAEKLLALLEEGKRSSTYKFAKLLALVELCFEKTKPDGAPPDFVTTRELASKVIEIYWGQAVPYRRVGRVLEQNQGPALHRGGAVSAKIVGAIAKLRAKHVGRTLHEVRSAHVRPFQAVAREVEQTLIKMPLPKLQRMGRVDQRFLYEIGWDDDVRQGTWSETRGFDNRIAFVEGAARNLVRLSSLLRPLIQRRWSAKVAELNGLESGELEDFLFGVNRTSLTRVLRPLLELQSGVCFYCRKRVGESPHVDHFIPWSRHADDGLDNLVVADERCNLAKRNFLAGSKHKDRWLERGSTQSTDLETIANDLPWPRDKARTEATARTMYRNVPGGFLWLVGTEFEAAD